jgi:hypothetical protein
MVVACFTSLQASCWRHLAENPTRVEQLADLGVHHLKHSTVMGADESQKRSAETLGRGAPFCKCLCYVQSITGTWFDW